MCYVRGAKIDFSWGNNNRLRNVCECSLKMNID